MARLVVVSRSMALAMRIADDHDVVEVPVEQLAELTPGPEVEVVVLDLGEPSAAMQALDRLRERGCRTPVLIVSGYQPAWNDLVDVSIERVVVVPLPITRAALLDGVDRLLGRAPARPARAPSAPGGPSASSAADGPPPTAGRAGRTSAPAAPGGSPGTPVTATPGVDVMTPPGGTARDQHDGADRGRGRLTRRRNGVAPGDAAEVAEPRARTGSPLAPATGPSPSPSPTVPATPEPDLFRPVVEPPVPVRSPSARPRTVVSPAPTARSGPAASPTPGAPPVPPSPAPDVKERLQTRPVPLRGRPASPPASSPPASSPPPDARVPRTPVTPAPAAPPTPPAGTRTPEALFPGAPPNSPGRGIGLHRSRDRGKGKGLERHPGFTPAAGVHAAPPAQRPDDVHTWVRNLLDHRGQLFGVNETAQVLADEVVERGESDAAAVLMPDGSRWRVSGGVGLRPLERRLLLDTSHWLISEIAVGGRALLIEDTDIVRPRLAGAPLAAWRHLLAVPVPGLRAAVVLARGQEAARFTERDLAGVVPVVAEAAPLLMAALQMRELARSLAPLRDVDHDR